MDNNERNEHFKGFAELLWDDLYQVAGAVMIDTITESDIREDAEITAQLKILIAQRAYDLVLHIYAEYTNVTLETALTLHLIDFVPDLTEWPKMTSIESAPDE